MDIKQTISEAVEKPFWQRGQWKSQAIALMTHHGYKWAGRAPRNMAGSGTHWFTNDIGHQVAIDDDSTWSHLPEDRKPAIKSGVGLHDLHDYLSSLKSQ